MTSYLVTIATDHQELVAKCAHGMNEQLLRQVLMFYPLGKKKTQKIGRGGGRGGNGWHPTVVGCPFFVSLNLVVLSSV